MNKAELLVTQMLLFPGKGLVLMCPSPAVAKLFMSNFKKRLAESPWARVGGNNILLSAAPESKEPE